jgi:hypothetical protein
LEDGDIGDTLPWSAMRFFGWHLSCCLEVRGWRTSIHKVTSRNFLPSLRELYDMFFHCETSHIYSRYIQYIYTVYNVSSTLCVRRRSGHPEFIRSFYVTFVPAFRVFTSVWYIHIQYVSRSVFKKYGVQKYCTLYVYSKPSLGAAN